jgi:hypothetical protein
LNGLDEIRLILLEVKQHEEPILSVDKAIGLWSDAGIDYGYHYEQLNVV